MGLLLRSRAISTCWCNSFREYIRRRPLAEGLAGPGVELARNGIQLRLGVAGEVGPLRQILPQQAIGVLVGAALPRTVRVAEVDLDAGGAAERGRRRVCRWRNCACSAFMSTPRLCRNRLR